VVKPSLKNVVNLSLKLLPLDIFLVAIFFGIAFSLGYIIGFMKLPNLIAFQILSYLIAGIVVILLHSYYLYQYKEKVFK